MRGVISAPWVHFFLDVKTVCRYMCPSTDKKLIALIDHTATLRVIFILNNVNSFSEEQLKSEHWSYNLCKVVWTAMPQHAYKKINLHILISGLVFQL